MSHCTVTYIEDKLIDEAEIGSHRQVAQSIAELIRQKNNQVDKAIALAGSWGSGKTTVIQFLEQELEKSREFNEYVFVFDTWSHEGEPLRRAFLEKLILFLDRKKLISRQDWEKRLQLLTGELKKGQKIEINGLIYIIVGLSSAIGVKLLSGDQLARMKIEDLTYFDLGSPLNTFLIFNFWLPSLLIAIPLVASIVNYWSPNWYKPIHRRLLSVDSESIETIKSTSIEFQKTFTQLVETVLRDEKQKLIIVIDNLDRIEPQKAFECLSTIHSLFDHDMHLGTWKERFWMIVPYDPEGIQEIWTGKEKKAELAASYIAKTFQVTFQVTEPILAEWKDFFIKKLTKAFPHHIQDEFHLIYRLYMRKRAPEKKPITPRDLKIFINQIAALHSQSSTEIPLVCVAIYILQRDLIAERIEGYRSGLVSPRHDDAIYKGEIIDKYVVSELAGQYDLKQTLVALHYNVEPAQAAYIIEGPALQLHLENRDVMAAKELEKVSGLNVILEDIVAKNYHSWASYTPIYLGNVGYTMDKLEIPESFELKRAWWLLGRGVNQVDLWLDINADCVKGLFAIAKRSQDVSLLARITESICNYSQVECKDDQVLISYTRPGEEKITRGFNLDEWLQAHLVFLTYLDKENALILEESYSLRTSVQSFLWIMGKAIQIVEKRPDTSEEALLYLMISSPPEEILNALEHRELNSQYPKLLKQMVENLEKYKESDESWDWEGLFKVLANKFEEDSIDDSIICLKSLFVIRREVSEELAEEIFSELSQHIQMFRILNINPQDLKYGDAVYPYLCMLLYNPNLDVATTSLETINQQYLNMVEEMLEKGSGYSPLDLEKFTAFLSNPPQTFVKLFIELLVRDDLIKQVLHQRRHPHFRDFIHTVLRTLKDSWPETYEQYRDGEL
jgi:Cdc6-like AAA superfamily ATPase